MQRIYHISVHIGIGCPFKDGICIIDRNGRFILHPDKNRMLKDTLDASVILKGKRGAVSAIVDGVPSWICYRNVKYVEWTLMMVVPKYLIQRHGRMLNLIILVVMAIGLAAIYLFCRRRIKEIADPFAAKKAAMERELSIAHDIQMSMLPSSLVATSTTTSYATTVSSSVLATYQAKGCRLHFSCRRHVVTSACWQRWNRIPVALSPA